MRRVVWVLMLVMIGVAGLALVTDGVGRFEGERRRSAEDALGMARRHLDSPVERLLVRSLRVVEVAPLKGEGCRWAVRVRAYSVFWLYRSVVVRCGDAGTWRIGVGYIIYSAAPTARVRGSHVLLGGTSATFCTLTPAWCLQKLAKPAEQASMPPQ